MRLLQPSLLLFLASSAPAQSHLFTFEHPTNLDQFGAVTAFAGDVDGDGHTDVLVGARTHDGAGANAGAAYLYSGRLGLLLDVFHGQAEDELGSSVAGAGDVDGDGLDDVALGAWHAGPGPVGSGAVRVHSGADGALIRTLPGPGPTSGFAWSMAAAGDVDGDGVQDLVVGAYLDDRPGMSSSDNAGSARVFSGADGSELLAVFGSSSSEQMGLSVAGVGDVDGDGLDDIAAGSRAYSSWRGIARVFRGADGAVLHELPGDQIGEEHGFAVAGAGDVDGDGVPDVLVGAPAVTTPSLAGSASVYSGATGAPLLELDGPHAGSRFGRHLAGIGDADGDGRADFAVGASLADSPTRQTAGATSVYSGVTGAPLFVLYGTTGSAFGYGLSGGGDADADGVPDLVIGIPGFNGAPEPVARARVVSGRELLLAGDRHLVSSSIGGTQNLAVRGGSRYAGHDYLILGSFSGTSPGTTFRGAHLPLNEDRYFGYSLTHPGQRVLVGTSGTLDAQGAADAAFVLLPDHVPDLVGLTLHHACLVLGASEVEAVSGPVPITVLP